MKTNAIVRIILFSLIALILLSLLLVGIFAKTLSFDGKVLGLTFGKEIEGGTVSSNGAVNAANITDISIEWAAGKIDIRHGDVDQITFSETSPEDNMHRMVWKQQGKELKLYYSDDSISLSGFGVTLNDTVAKDLTITVPHDWECGELSLDVAAANVEITGMVIDEVDFDVASGICRFENCTVRELSVDTASGDIHYSGCLDVFDCDAASADCVLNLTNQPRRIDLDTMSGDLELVLPEDCGFTLSLDALSSDFTTDFAAAKKNDSYVYGDGGCKISVDGMSGDVNIKKAKSHSEGTF